MSGLDDPPDGGAPVPMFERISARIALSRTLGAAGTSIFASTYLDANASGTPSWPEVWSRFSADGGPYQHGAAVPEIDWR